MPVTVTGGGPTRHDSFARFPVADSRVLSRVIPLVETAEDNLGRFALKHKRPDLKVRKIAFDVPERFLPEVLDWSESRARRLFDIGSRAGERHAASLEGIG